MKTSEWLDAAADYIEKHGWVQGSNDPSGKRCVVEALEDTAAEWWWDTTAALPYLACQFDPNISDYALRKSRSWALQERVENWNDYEVDSASEVIDTLRWAAKTAREDERERSIE